MCSIVYASTDNLLTFPAPTGPTIASKGNSYNIGVENTSCMKWLSSCTRIDRTNFVDFKIDITEDHFLSAIFP